MMNFPLRNLENQLYEECLLEGEYMLASGAVESLRELERHLWVASVATEGQNSPLEVEVKISPSKVLAASCECAAFRRESQCAHFAAVLLALRRELQKRRDEAPPRKPAGADRPRKLTTSVVLENVDPEELLAFVREYARKNRSFAIALKARFTAQVGNFDSKEKFVQLLDSAITLARRPDGSINQRGLGNIRKVLAELRLQREEALAKKYYSEVFSIFQAIVERIPPLLSKIRSSAEVLSAEIRSSFQALQAPGLQNLAPELRQAIWDYSLREFDKRLFRKHGIDLLFLQVLTDLALEPAQINELLSALEEQEDKYREEKRQQDPILLLRWHLLENKGRENLAERLLVEHLLQPGLLFPALDVYLQKGRNQLVQKLALLAIEKGVDAENAFRLKDYLLKIALKEGNPEQVDQLLEERFLATLDPAVYRQLQENHTGDWEQRRRALAGRVEQLPAGNRRREAMAVLLAEETDPERLLNALREIRSLDLLQRFDQLLIDSYPEELFVLYHDWLSEYIQQHLGPKSSRRIREVLDHLKSAGLRELAARLVQEFRESYPERHTLMEELSPF